MSDPVFVVVDSLAEGLTRHFVHGAYSAIVQARMAAWGGDGRLVVLRLWLDELPVDEAEELEP